MSEENQVQLPAGQVQLSAKTTDDSGATLQGSCVVYFGENLSDFVSFHGEEAAFEAVQKGATLRVQQEIRTLLNEGATQEKLNEYFSANGGYKVDFSRKERSTDPKTRLRRILAAMSDEERADFFAEYGEVD